MAVFTIKAPIVLEENQYNNFAWIGECEDGKLLCKWDEEVLINNGDKETENHDNKTEEVQTSTLATVTQIALISRELQNAHVLYSFDKIVPVVQATLDLSRNLLGFVLRKDDCTVKASRYSAFVAEIEPQRSIYSLNIDVPRQVLVEFLKHTPVSGDTTIAKLLVCIHDQGIYVHSFPMSKLRERWIVSDQPLSESVSRSFVWAQWNSRTSTLFYLHHREDTNQLESFAVEDSSPNIMLTALQFQSNKPRETVLNIPLDLAGLQKSPIDFGVATEYRDQGLLHVIGDPCLDLRVLTCPNGAVCICHHYIYKSTEAETPADIDNCPVYLAYSVTLIHHGCVLHSVTPNVSWATAQMAVPSYSLLSDSYLLVLIPGICVHILDIGLGHPPTNHIISSAIDNQLLPNSILYQINNPKLCPAKALNFIDVTNQVKVEVRVTKESLYNMFKNTSSASTKVAIMHMASVHDKDHDLARKLVWNACEDLQNLDTTLIYQEYLLGETFAAVSKHIDCDATHLLSLLPMTTSVFTPDATDDLHSDNVTKISYCKLESACIMLLSPRERLLKDTNDLWTKLGEHTSSCKRPRFNLSDIVDKLIVSLDTYKPETLSQGSTPISPASPLVGGLTISSLGLTLAHLMFDPLPFNENENTTSSKLEHLLSVNLRELSMYFLKHFPNESPIRVHAVCSKYVCTQLQVSRRLCSIVCSTQALVPTEATDKGFSFVDQLNDSSLWKLFALFEKYHLATEAVAFPLPQGCSSFFAYMAYKSLSHELFMQYVKKGVLQLNVDVLRAILFDLDDTEESVEQKLEIVSSVPVVRCVRALQFWSHPISALLRSRLHAASILAGEGSGQPKLKKSSKTVDTGQSDFQDSTSSISSFIELLSAKAKLSDLDLGLLQEGVSAAMEFGRQTTES